MGCLGGLRAITKEELDKLRSVPRADRVPDYLDEMEQVDSCELDKAWDAIHRALNCSRLEFGQPLYPDGWVILGGEVLRGDRPGEEDYIVVCKDPEHVKQVYQFLLSLTEKQFREYYFAIDPEAYEMEPDEDDFEYTWYYLKASIPFWKNAAEKQLWVLFDVDQ